MNKKIVVTIISIVVIFLLLAIIIGYIYKEANVHENEDLIKMMDLIKSILK